MPLHLLFNVVVVVVVVVVIIIVLAIVAITVLSLLLLLGLLHVHVVERAVTAAAAATLAPLLVGKGREDHEARRGVRVVVLAPAASGAVQLLDVLHQPVSSSSASVEKVHLIL